MYQDVQCRLIEDTGDNMNDRGYVLGMNYARGGNVHDQMNMGQAGEESGGAQIAHFNPHELALMDEIQGGRTPDPKTGLPEYFVLDEMLKSNPDLIELLAESFVGFHEQYGHHQGHHSHGMNEMASHGRFGDTELAIIPDSLADTLDSIIGGPQFNPEDGKREYFFGALLSLAARAIPALIRGGSMAARGATSIGRAASKFGSGALRTVAKNAPGALKSAANVAKQGLAFAAKNAPAAMNFANDSGLTGVAAQYLMNKMMPQPQQEPQYDEGAYDAPSPQFGEADYGPTDDNDDPRNAYYR